MNSSEFLRLSPKGKDRFEWTGDVQNLDVFFRGLGFSGTWSRPKGEGNPHTRETFSCTWYATKKTLLIQGKRPRECIDKLHHVLKNPIALAIPKEEKSKVTEPMGVKDPVGSAASQSSFVKHAGKDLDCPKDGSVSTDFEAKEELSEAQVYDGINPGNLIKKVMELRMRKWDQEGAKITIATPFLDKTGLNFISSCIQNETTLDRIYTREVCSWNNKKIDKVMAEANLSKKLIEQKVCALNKVPSFHAKFLAGEYGEKVEVILTSCNMTSEHLLSEQLETLIRIETPVSTFHSVWLSPLEKLSEKGRAEFLNMDDIGKELQNIQ